MNGYIHSFLSDTITHQYSQFNGGLILKTQQGGGGGGGGGARGVWAHIFLMGTHISLMLYTQTAILSSKMLFGDVVQLFGKRV